MSLSVNSIIANIGFKFNPNLPRFAVAVHVGTRGGIIAGMSGGLCYPLLGPFVICLLLLLLLQQFFFLPCSRGTEYGSQCVCLSVSISLG